MTDLEMWILTFVLAVGLVAIPYSWRRKDT